MARNDHRRACAGLIALVAFASTTWTSRVGQGRVELGPVEWLEVTLGGVRWLTLGGFVVNPSFPARPDNSGRALLRYATHVEVELTKVFGAGVDATFFSDRRAKNPVAPSELDFTAEAIARLRKVETHLAYERDMPVDRGGLVQQLLYLSFVVAFDP